jgi:hypothetical protein
LLSSGVFSAEYQQYVVNYETAVKSYQQSLSFHTYKSFFDVRRSPPSLLLLAAVATYARVCARAHNRWP